MESNVTDSNIQLINCDWLQFYGHHHGVHVGVSDKGTNYELVSLGCGTRVFGKLVQVYERASITRSHRRELLATIAYSPHSSVLDSNLFQCKVENKVLYQELPYHRVMAMIKALNLDYHGLSRVDVCVDLHRFANNMQPLELLRLYRKNLLIKRGSRRYSQWLTAPYSPSKLTGVVTDDILSEEHVTHCVSWGGPNSDVHVKMYNKTKEIKEESKKHYITSYWRNNGLSAAQDVWRVEFSVTRRSKYLYDNSSGDTVPIPLEWTLKRTYLAEVFAALARRHFAFIEVKRGCKVPTKPNVVLFNVDGNRVMEASTRQSTPDATRMAKTCANYLAKVIESHDLDAILQSQDYDKYVLQAAAETLNKLYGGLKMLGKKRRQLSNAEIDALQQHRDWLATWGILPDTIDGVPFGQIDKLMSEADCRMKFLEGLDLYRREMAAAMANIACLDN